MLFKRKSEAKRIKQELYEELEPLNQELKKRLGFPKNNRNVLWAEMVFNSAIHVYVEALNCYHYNLFEASTIMCRNTIDSAIFVACENIRTTEPATYTIREDTKNAEGWLKLKKKAIELLLFEEKYLEFVEKLGQTGHFSAHLAERQSKAQRQWEKKSDPLFRAWEKENKDRLSKGLSSIPPPLKSGYKGWTSPQEALIVLEDTKDILVKLIQNYFTSEKTIDRNLQ